MDIKVNLTQLDFFSYQKQVPEKEFLLSQKVMSDDRRQTQIKNNNNKKNTHTQHCKIKTFIGAAQNLK